MGLERVKNEGLEQVKIETSRQSERTNINKEYQDDFVTGVNTFLQVENSSMHSLRFNEGSLAVGMEEQQIEVQTQEKKYEEKETNQRNRTRKIT